MSAVTTTDNLPSFSQNVYDEVDKVLGVAAADIERIAKQLVPQKTGRLQNTILHFQVEKHHWAVPANTPYARRWEINDGFTDSLGRTYGPAAFLNGRTDHYLENAGAIIAENMMARLKAAFSKVQP